MASNKGLFLAHGTCSLKISWGLCLHCSRLEPRLMEYHLSLQREKELWKVSHQQLNAHHTSAHILLARGNQMALPNFRGWGQGRITLLCTWNVGDQL